MNIKDVFATHYNENIQLSPFQAQTIASAIMSRYPACNLLVFGLGNDTGLWLELNKFGVTYFLETSKEWTEKVRAKFPNISVGIMPRFGLTVEKSMNLTADDMSAYPPPQALKDTHWDVILVDAPPGYKPQDPGRAVAIYWASCLATPDTHVFVDDYERPLESRMADMLVREGRTNMCTEIPSSHKRSKRRMFWSIGTPFSPEQA